MNYFLYFCKGFYAQKMKDFLKYTLATITGVVFVGTVTVFFCILAICGLAIAGSGDKTVVLQDNSVLVVKLSGEIVEHTDANVFDEYLGGSESMQQGLDEIVTAIDKAAQCPEIKGIYLEAGIMSADYASLQEIRKAIERFKAGGNEPKQEKSKAGKVARLGTTNSLGEKFVVAYGDEYTQGAYYVCSAADEIWMNPQGMVDLHGIAAQPMYLKELLGKVGIKMTVVKVGKYKSATEQYTETKMSDANREQVTRYATNLWNVIKGDISRSRGIDSNDLDSIADNIIALEDSRSLKTSYGLIDEVMYASDVKNAMKKILNLSSSEEVPQVSCKDMCSISIKRNDSKASAYTGNDKAKDKIAVYYCNGSIVQNAASGIIMGDAGIVSKKMIDNLKALEKDENVKAVVIRINSGGGDAFASEDIWHAVINLKAKKPVVVSMGGMAASGAYYLSAGASWIVAQPTTLTGSIGIFGVFPDMSELMQQKLGIKFDVVKTNKHADMDFTQSARPFDAEEQIMLQRYIDRGYELFCKRVADGRKISIDSVKNIAEGRVWTGDDALKIGLIDQLGGMPEAIRKAAAMARITDYALLSYPTPASVFDQLFETVSGNDNNLDEQLRSTLGVFYEPYCLVRGIEKQSPIQARIPMVLKVR